MDEDDEEEVVMVAQALRSRAEMKRKGKRRK